jgi:hypothetical protein
VNKQISLNRTPEPRSFFSLHEHIKVLDRQQQETYPPLKVHLGIQDSSIEQLISLKCKLILLKDKLP